MTGTGSPIWVRGVEVVTLYMRSTDVLTVNGKKYSWGTLPNNTNIALFQPGFEFDIVGAGQATFTTATEMAKFTFSTAGVKLAFAFGGRAKTGQGYLGSVLKAPVLTDAVTTTFSTMTASGKAIAAKSVSVVAPKATALAVEVTTGAAAAFPDGEWSVEIVLPIARRTSQIGVL